jgi:hypothetical protein
MQMKNTSHEDNSLKSATLRAYTKSNNNIKMFIHGITCGGMNRNALGQNTRC